MTYLGYEVLDWPVAVDSITLSLKSKYNIIGDVWQNRQLNVQHNPYSLFKFTFFQDDNAQRKELRDFFKARQGRHENFFIRSYKNDLKMIKDTKVGESILYLEQGYDLEALTDHAQFIYIEGHGTVYRIISLTDIWDDALSQQIVAAQISPAAPFLLEKGCTLLEICYFGRWDTDTLSFDYNDIWTSSVSLPFREASDTEIGLVL